MRTYSIRLQRGQAISEFIAAMALFVPLVLGVIYLGRFGDIKHQAIQASRYAAMERALDPNAHQSDAGIENETVARFFRDAGRHPIGLNDVAQGSTAGDENPNWVQVNGDPLIAQYSDVSVRLGAASIDSDLLAPLDAATGLFNRLSTGVGIQADVRVPVANIVNLGYLGSLMANLGLTIEATTVMAGDPWNGGGIQDVANHFTQFSVPGKSPAFLPVEVALAPYVAALSNSVQPQFGCVKPDIVPPSAVHAGKYDPMDNPISPSNPNDQCY